MKSIFPFHTQYHTITKHASCIKTTAYNMSICFYVSLYLNLIIPHNKHRAACWCFWQKTQGIMLQDGPKVSLINRFVLQMTLRISSLLWWLKFVTNLEKSPPLTEKLPLRLSCQTSDFDLPIISSAHLGKQGECVSATWGFACMARTSFFMMTWQTWLQENEFGRKDTADCRVMSHLPLTRRAAVQKVHSE